MATTSISRRRILTGLALAAGLSIGGVMPFGAATASAAKPIGDGPEPPDNTDAARILASLRVSSYTATPVTVLPFKSSILAWSVVRSGASVGVAGIQFRVAGAVVPAAGQKAVTPTLDVQAYQLVASLDNASRTLGSRVVSVDTSQCLNLPIGQNRIQTLVTNNLASLPPEVKARLLSPSVTVTVDTAGIRVRLTSEVEVDNFPNPTVTVNALVGVGAANGLITTRLISSSVETTFPWWVHFVPPIVSEFIMNAIANRIRSEIVNALPAIVRAAAAEVNTLAASSTFGVWSVTPSSQLLTVKLCPR